MSCCDCTVFACMKGGELPDDCATKLCAADARDQVLELYLNTDMRPIMQTATVVALKGTKEKWPRLREVIEFAHVTGVKRIGIGSCATYVKEIPLLADILRAEGFADQGQYQIKKSCAGDANAGVSESFGLGVAGFDSRGFDCRISAEEGERRSQEYRDLSAGNEMHEQRRDPREQKCH